MDMRKRKPTTAALIRAYIRKQGRIGGLTRAKRLTQAERRAIARKAARARWVKRERT